MTQDFAALRDENFVSLTTFKKSGEGVAAPVWIVADGDQLLVWTPSDSWKVKRIRRDPRVALVPCGGMGKIHTTAAPVDGTAEVVEDPSVVTQAVEALSGSTVSSSTS